MGMMDKFMNVIRLNADDEDDEIYEDEFYDDDEEEVEAPKKSSRKSAPAPEPVAPEPPRYSSPRAMTPPPAPRPARNSDASMEVCVIKPTSLEDGREITETLLAHRTVVLNLEGVDLDLGQRIIDFTSGSCYALDGNLQKITNYIFIVTPNNVDISGDFQSIMSHFDMGSFHADI